MTINPITLKSMILASIWGKTLNELQLQRVVAETIDRAAPAGDSAPTAGRPVAAPAHAAASEGHH